MKKIVLVFFVLLVYAGCGGEGSSSGGSDVQTNVTLNSIDQEASELGNFPEESEVVELEAYKVDDESVEGTESTELADTEDETVEVSVTIPDSLSRSKSLLTAVKLWINGECIDVDFDLSLRTGTFLVNLELGENYFCTIFELEGKSYRTPLVKVTRIEATASVTPTPSPSPTPTPTQTPSPTPTSTPTPTPATEIETTISFNYDDELVSEIGDVTVTVKGQESLSVVTSGKAALIQTLEPGSYTFTVLANTSSADTTAALQFYGEASVDVSDVSNSVDVAMKLHKTKVVVPDQFVNRIVYFSDIETASSTTWKEISATDLGFTYSSDLKAYDVQFDNAGRTYFSNGYANGIYRMSQLSGSGLALIEGTDSAVVEIFSIDQDSGTIYFVDLSVLYSIPLEGSDSGPVSVHDFSGSTLTAVLAPGNNELFISGIFSDGVYLKKYTIDANVVTETASVKLTTDTDTSITDIACINNKLYISVDPDSSSSPTLASIQRYSEELVFDRTLGVSLYGPQNFLGIRPEDIIVIDEDSETTPHDRLLRITDFDADETESYFDTTNQDFLRFYEC